MQAVYRLFPNPEGALRLFARHSVTAETGLAVQRSKITNRSGVFRIPEGQLRVSCSQGMTLSVAPGAVYACGVCASIDDAKTVTLAYGDAALPRIDRVVARLDRSARCMARIRSRWPM